MPDHASAAQPAAALPDLRALGDAAEARIRPYVVETPLEPSRAFEELTGLTVFLKRENLQHTGSFKARGAFNKLLSLSDRRREAGVVAASTGNHGAAVAYAMATLGVSGLIFVPEDTEPSKLANIRRFGGDVRFHGTDSADTERFARAYARERGMTYVSPYNDWEVVAGQATIGVEIARSLPTVGTLIASVGGGGLIGGTGGYLKARDPGVRVIGASARNSKAMMESVLAGQVIETRHTATLSDGTAGGIDHDTITFALCRAVVDRFDDFDEAAIRAALRAYLDGEHQLIEGAAALAIAALLAQRAGTLIPPVVVVICGANIGAERLKQAL